ncbi:MAG TPA: hypothetical protein PK413_03925, partial [Thermoanaerobaculia bacterium]|nr:hypothetical protein [Thermoanaerobaculia bacterium]
MAKALSMPILDVLEAPTEEAIVGDRNRKAGQASEQLGEPLLSPTASRVVHVLSPFGVQWEGGAAASGEIRPGLSYDVVMHTGLIMPFTGDDAFRPREGRTEVA